MSPLIPTIKSEYSATTREADDCRKLLCTSAYFDNAVILKGETNTKLLQEKSLLTKYNLWTDIKHEFPFLSLGLKIHNNKEQNF